MNYILDICGLIFLFIFTFEALIKIFALGFVSGYKTYLKDYWNILDFIIVVTGLVEFFIDILYKTNTINLKVLRLLRVLRPLKGLKTIPSLRKQVSALLRSIEGLSNVMVFLGFIFLIFGIIGL